MYKNALGNNPFVPLAKNPISKAYIECKKPSSDLLNPITKAIIDHREGYLFPKFDYKL